MTLNPFPHAIARHSFRLLLLLTIALLFTSNATLAQRRGSAKKKSQASNSSKKSSKSNSRSAKNSRGSKGRTHSARNSKSSRRESVARNSRSRGRKQASRVEVGRNGKPLSRRESRRLAAIRRREAIEAARRARAAALARQRAFDQSLRDETSANIANDSTVGEDLEVRRIALEALGTHAGSVVVMDPKSGRVYTVVNQEWALRRGYKPCSTIKLVTGLAGLCEKVIDPIQPVSGRGIDLTDSLAYSDNPYFQSVGGRVGFDRIMSYARELGIGERTGVNYANEFAGRVPLYKSGYAVNHMCSHGDDFEVTPIQLASLVSAIANGGELLTPHVPRTPEEGLKFKREVRRKVNIPEDTLRRMIPGMIGAVSYGTARGAYDPMQTVAGKTGTCIGQGSWLGLFTSYAPVAEPKLAVVVVTRGSGERGRVAAAIAGRIYRGLNRRFGTPTNMPIANAPEIPRPKVTPRAGIISDENEVDESDMAGMDGADSTNPAPDNSASKVRTVLMPVQTNPTNQARQTVPAPAATPQASPKEAQRPRRVGSDQQ